MTDNITVQNNENPAINLTIIDNNNNAIISFNETIASHNTELSSHDEKFTRLKSELEAEIYLKANNSEMTSSLANKVDKVSGKALSSNDLTDTLKSNYDSSYTNSHTHSNKTALDLIKGTNTGDQPTLCASNMSTLANNATTPNTLVDFSSGFCWDDTLTAKITSAAITKSLAATFTAGTGNGGLDAGTKAANTWYHCFAIAKVDGTSDYLFSTSVSAPIMPNDYVYKRRIGSIKTNSSGNILGFTQYPNGEFRWNAWQQDIIVNNAIIASQNVLLTINTPLGVKTQPRLQCLFANTNSTAINFVMGGVVRAYLQNSVVGEFNWQTVQDIFTTTSSQITYGVDNSTINITYFNIYTLGWKDFRGEK